MKCPLEQEREPGEGAEHSPVKPGRKRILPAKRRAKLTTINSARVGASKPSLRPCQRQLQLPRRRSGKGAPRFWGAFPPFPQSPEPGTAPLRLGAFPVTAAPPPPPAPRLPGWPPPAARDPSGRAGAAGGRVGSGGGGGGGSLPKGEGPGRGGGGVRGAAPQPRGRPAGGLKGADTCGGRRAGGQAGSE